MISLLPVERTPGLYYTTCKKIALDISVVFYVHECLCMHVCTCTICVPGVLRVQRHLNFWNWSYIWMVVRDYVDARN